MLYLLEDNDKSRQVMGQYIEIYHYLDGKIELRANGTALPCSAYDRLTEVNQGAIVENKWLEHALAEAKTTMGNELPPLFQGVTTLSV